VPQRAGNRLPVSPAAVINTYATKDDSWVTVTSGTVRSVQNVARLLGLPIEEFQTVEQQQARRVELDELLAGWIIEHTVDEAVSVMREAQVTASRIYTIEDIMSDETYRERDAAITVDDPELGPVRMQGVIPKLTYHAGHVWRTGPTLGQDNEYVLGTLLGLSAEEIAGLKGRSVV
jgi:crotonobetainyl-CoA:carnitine CoA-transferase CaiB-like acyl-CoA transferase